MHMTLYNNYTLQTLNISPEAKLCLCSSKVDFLLLLVLLYCCLGWVCCSHIWGQEKSWAIQIERDKAFYCIIYLFYWKASPPSCSKQTDQTYTTYSLLAVAGPTLGPSPSHDKLQMCFFSLPLFVLLCENAMLPCHSDISAIALTFVVISMGCFMNNSL